MLSSIWPHFLEEKICQKLQKCHPKGHLKIFSAKPEKNGTHANMKKNDEKKIFFNFFFSDSWQPISMWLPSYGFHALVAKIWSSKTSGTSLQGTCQVSAFSNIMTYDVTVIYFLFYYFLFGFSFAWTILFKTNIRLRNTKLGWRWCREIFFCIKTLALPLSAFQRN